MLDRKARVRTIAVVGAIVALGSGVPASIAGELDPPAGPAATRPEIPTDWSRRLLSNDGPECNSSRFKCLWPVADPGMPGGSVVLDRETGLVWNRGFSQPGQGQYWQLAEACAGFEWEPGGRRGFRVPTAAEMGTLFDSSIQPSPDNPDGLKVVAGHPFILPAGDVWFATSTPRDDPSANNFITVNFSKFQTDSIDSANGSTQQLKVLCVRGPE